MNSDLNEITKALHTLYKPGDVIELRALDVNGKTIAGYFDDFDKLANEAGRLSGQASGVYTVLNKINPDLLARAANRTGFLKNTTSDKDVLRRCYLPLDMDCVRPAGISSTDEEHEYALSKAKELRAYLETVGFPKNSLIAADSGNGAHTESKIDLPNDKESEELIKSCLAALAAKFNDSRVVIDTSVFNAARIWKLSGTLARKGDATATRPHRIARLLDVPAEIIPAPIEALKALASTAPKVEPRQAAPAYRGTGQPFDLDKFLADHDIQVKSVSDYEGGKKYILNHCVFDENHNGSSAAIIQYSSGALQYKCLHNSCVDKTWKDLRELYEPGYRNRAGYQPVSVVPKSEPTNDNPIFKDFTQNDVGNGRRLVSLYGDRIRYNYPRNKWLIWTGLNWQWDDGNLIMSLAKKTILSIYKEAATLEDDEKRKKLIEFAVHSESVAKLKSMCEAAQSEPGIPISISDLDSNQWLFNCENGTIDLKTGELRQHDKNDYCTIIAPVRYKPGIKSELWEKYLNRAMDHNKAMIAYLQKLSGYSMTGDTSEEKVPFTHGAAGTGKSTFIFAERTLMGEYAYTMNAETLMIKNDYGSGNSTNDELANLNGKRWVFAREIQKDSRLNESELKSMTGGERMNVAHKYERNIEFQPIFKVWLSGNHKPIVADTTNGVWRRLKLIPFEVVIPDSEKDEQLKKKLTRPDELSGILNWNIAGCLAWQKEGLKEPDKVESATFDYRKHEDRLLEFINDYLTYDPQATIGKTEAHTKHTEWCNVDSEREPLTFNQFKTLMEERGQIREKRLTGGLRGWQGVRWATPEELENRNKKDANSDGVTLVTVFDKTFPHEGNEPKFTENQSLPSLTFKKSDETVTSDGNFSENGAKRGAKVDEKGAYVSPDGPCPSCGENAGCYFDTTYHNFRCQSCQSFR